MPAGASGDALAIWRRSERLLRVLSGLSAHGCSQVTVALASAPPAVTTCHCCSSSESSKERLRISSAYSPPSADRLMSSKKIPHSVGLTLWPGWLAATVIVAGAARKPAADINAAQNILSTVSAVKSVQNALSQGTAALSVNINKFR